MNDVEKVIKGLKELRSHFHAMAGIASSKQGRESHTESAKIVDDAIKLLKSFESIESALHLCDSCAKIYPECDATKDGVIFGTGVGNDNIVCCDGYVNCRQEPVKPIRMNYTQNKWIDPYKCPNCEYADQFHNADCETYLLRDTLALLKAQEPRLLTLQEADKAPYVWLESKEGGLGVRRIRIVPIDSTAISIQTFGRPDTIGCIYEFEKRFRCWNAKPTDEQRQNEPWKE